MTPEALFAGAVDHANRKRLGQFFTPPTVAQAMVRWVCAGRPANLLDPAVGPGIFVEALARSGDRWVQRVVAYDVDASALRLAGERIAPDRFAQYERRRADFLTARIDERFDAIVCNPPYIRHHDAKLPDEVFQSFGAAYGVRLSRMTNMYCLFLLKILSLLSPRGRAAVITPSEFLNADYGRAIKAILLGNPAFRGHIVFDHARLVFDGVMTTATITLLDACTARSSAETQLWHEHPSCGATGETPVPQVASQGARVSDARGAAGENGSNNPSGRNGKIAEIAEPGDAVTLVRVSNVDEMVAAFELFGSGASRLNAGLSVARLQRSRLDPAAKWPAAAFDDRCQRAVASMRPLSDFANCTRGIATGANRFFTLTRQEALDRNLPADLLTPCLCKAAHARGPAFGTAEFEALRADGKKCLILDACPDDAERIAAYLAYGKSIGVHERYLTRHRPTWFVIERRQPADLLVTVFGRKRLRFVRNLAGVLNLTAFHGITLKPAYRGFAAYLMCYFHSAASLAACAAEHRVYGDGLLKFEPRDVERLRVPDLDTVAPNDVATAEALAARWTAVESATAIVSGLGSEAIRQIEALFPGSRRVG